MYNAKTHNSKNNGICSICGGLFSKSTMKKHLIGAIKNIHKKARDFGSSKPDYLQSL
jgi:hypothetical protein